MTPDLAELHSVGGVYTGGASDAGVVRGKRDDVRIEVTSYDGLNPKQIALLKRGVQYAKQFKPINGLIYGGIGLLIGAISFVLLETTPAKKLGIDYLEGALIGFTELLIGLLIGLIKDLYNWYSINKEIKARNLDDKINYAGLTKKD